MVSVQVVGHPIVYGLWFMVYGLWFMVYGLGVRIRGCAHLALPHSRRLTYLHLDMLDVRYKFVHFGVTDSSTLEQENANSLTLEQGKAGANSTCVPQSTELELEERLGGFHGLWMRGEG